jgi:hypothetical protein
MAVSAIYWITEAALVIIITLLASKCWFAHYLLSSRAAEHVLVIFSLVRLLGVNQGKQ